VIGSVSRIDRSHGLLAAIAHRVKVNRLAARLLRFHNSALKLRDTIEALAR
jgi:hypothetical protein